ncbi:tol-pal system YbgF family protein [Rufibacter sp. XAAS-G3-1]|uniref:tetratricopeptide repeat protein n=1 Tax=Rufibacter sp. XAAS-G3-1 TaxID=2729134 RepID=UPI0015E6B21B|nr:tetratricopeptide repeat protein [Rufibacter sp. XAAS-G3-1]
MNNQVYKSFLNELDNKNVFKKGATVFGYSNGKYDVFSKLSASLFYYFKIEGNEIVIKDRKYKINSNQDIVDIIKNEATISLGLLQKVINTSTLESYNELYVIENKQSPNFWTDDFYSDFEDADNCFYEGHESNDYNTAISLYIKGFLLGINYKQGLDLTFDSIAKLAKDNGNYALALNLFEKCVKWKLARNEMFLYYYIAECNYALNDFANAIENINHNLKLHKSPDALYLRAKSYLALNEKAKAKIDLTDIVSNTQKDYGLNTGDRMSNSENWNTYQKYGEVQIIHNSKKLLANI